MKTQLYFLLTGFLLTLSTWSFADEVVIEPSQQVAEAQHLPGPDKKVGWSAYCVARGGTTIISGQTREFDEDGDQVGYSTTLNVTSHSGAVAAVPIGDFEPLEQFAYKSKTGIETGRLVSVSIQLSTGNTTPTELVMQRAVENLTKAGAPLPATAGAKPGRILPMLESAKRRYGARLAKPRYDAPSGHVLILLLDCRAEKADDTFLPATPQGYTRKQRAEMAKPLAPTTDKGGTRIFATETTIAPAVLRPLINGKN